MHVIRSKIEQPILFQGQTTNSRLFFLFCRFFTCTTLNAYSARMFRAAAAAAAAVVGVGKFEINSRQQRVSVE
jgi:hypothetical protein